MEPLRQKDPKTIGPYTLIGRLGAGGMGIVYLAARGSESVALKVVRESLIDDPSEATRFTREIEALQLIDSPYVARIIASGFDDERAWLATEFVNGPDLKTLVSDKGPLPEKAWFKLADGLLAGLMAIHRAGIIHRDVKPGNIILAESGPKLIDFGIAQVSDVTSITSSGLVAGSPAWFSPEQIEGHTLTPSTDLFSAGSVLVFAAKGSSPWGDESTMTKASVFRVLTDEPDTTGLSQLQLEHVLPLLAKEPAERFVFSAAEVRGKVRDRPSQDETDPEVSSNGFSGASNSQSSPATTSRFRTRIFQLGAILALVVGAVVAASFYILPTNGPLTVYLVNNAGDDAPSRLELKVGLGDLGQMPAPQFTRRGMLLNTSSFNSQISEWNTGLEWTPKQTLFLTLTDESGELIDEQIDMSEHAALDGLWGSEIGIQVFIEKEVIRLVVLSPILTFNGPLPKETYSWEVSRTPNLDLWSDSRILDSVEGITLETDEISGTTVFRVRIYADSEILERPELGVQWRVANMEDQPSLGDCYDNSVFRQARLEGQYILECKNFDSTWRDRSAIVKFFVVYSDYGRPATVKWSHLGGKTADGRYWRPVLSSPPQMMPMF